LYRADDHRFFIVIMVIGGSTSGVANPKLWGRNVWLQANNITFVWDAASQSTKLLDLLKFGAHGPLGSPGYTYGSCTACFSWEVCTHS